LPATTIFDHPTPTTLTEHLHQQLTPNTADMAREEQVQGASVEAEIRRALMGVPLTRLREAGLMKPLLVLLGLEDPEAEDSETSGSGEGAIDDMDVDDLLQIALGTDS
ncbi:acyl carrier protein, partial [Streptomyces sp. NPDC047525]|uniref:acyl carrier protein n=1 Tax=Streptomyces sp. NPDC047525 TaxID=3155264 RepID=UPI0033ED3B65